MKRAVLFCLVLAACKSGEGDRCQVDSDCSGDLVCNTSKNTCESQGASNPIDGSVPDAPADAPAASN